MIGKAVLAGVALVLAVPASAQKAPPPPQPSTEPDWTEVRRSAEAALKANLFDPESAQLTWDGGWRWGHIKPFQLWSKRTYGWLGCVSVNAKNRFGGYVGAEPYYVLVTTNGRVSVGRVGLVTSECDVPNATPLQSAFRDAAPNAGAPLSIADELAKLADLRDRKIITEDEFQAQKTKLLSR